MYDNALVKTNNGATGHAKKAPRRKPTPDAVYVGIKMEKPMKTRMEIIAATRNESFAAFSNRLLELGLEEYLKGSTVDMVALEALEATARSQV